MNCTVIEMETKHEVEMLHELVETMWETDSKYPLVKYELLLKNAMTTGIAILIAKLTKEEKQELLNYAWEGELFTDDEHLNNPYDVNQHLIDLFPVK